MTIPDIKQKQLNLSALITLSLSVWIRSLVPFLTIISMMLIFTVALIVSFLLLLPVIPLPFLVILATFSLTGLVIIFDLLFISFINIADDIICGIKPSVFNAIENVGIKGFLKLMGSCLLIALVVIIFRLPLLLTDNPLLMLPYIILAFIIGVTGVIYTMFFPQAIFLRGAGSLQAFTYSYYLVKNCWWQTLGRVLVCLVIEVVLVGVIMGIMAGLFMAINGSDLAGLADMYKINPQMAVLGMLSIGKSLLVVLLIGYLLIGFVSVFPIVASTVLFNNLEIEEPQKKAPEDNSLLIQGTQLDIGAIPEFTEMFKNVKEIDISTATDTEKFANPQKFRTREEVLRNFEPIDIPIDIPEGASEQKNNAKQNIVQRIDDFPTTQAAQVKKKDLRLQPQEKGKMPTLDITTRVKSNRHGLPSIYKPEEGE